MNKLENEVCPFCRKKTLTLIEDEKDIPYFGKCFIYSMICSSCSYKKADVEAAERKDPTRYTFEIENQKDLNIRVIKSSEATIKVPQLKLTVTPGPASEGFISNIEGLLSRFKEIIQSQKDDEDEEVKKKVKNMLKKLWKVECGDEKLKIIIEDPSGNSAIISEKAKVEKLK